jgi:D-alanyl-D-alanine carboxypeptidase
LEDKIQDQIEVAIEDFLKDYEEVLGALVKLEISNRHAVGAAKGFFDNSKRALLKPQDQFSVGSTTKMFTATLVHQLIEDNKIELSGKIIKHLPFEWIDVLGNIEHGAQISIEQALSHRSGIYDYIINTTFFYQMLKSRRWTPLQLLKLVKAEGKPNFKPGESFNYSNTNYLLLGAMIEHVTCKPIKTVYRENIFSRLGLKNTFLSEGPIGSNREGIAHGYFREGDKIYDFQDMDSGWAWAAGGIISNADDLNTFIQSLVAGRLFREKATFQQMSELPKGNTWYALGIMSMVHPDYGRYYYHSGYDGATSSIVCYFPERKTVITVCITYNGKSTRLRAKTLMDLIINKLNSKSM